MSAEENPEEVKFSIFPQKMRDQVTKDVQVLNSERIIGYNTYNDILENTKSSFTELEDNSDFYNVTVNFIVKRKPTNPSGKAVATQHKELQVADYEKAISQVEKSQYDKKL